MKSLYSLCLSLFDRVTRYPLSARLLLAANVGALGFAFIMQFAFGVAPCILCLWQRVPYAAAGLIALGVVLVGPRRRFAARAFYAAMAVYVAGFGIACFHTGVERHWWAGTAGCHVQPLAATGSAEDLRQALLQTVMPACDSISWSLLGLSLTNMNVAFSLAMAAFALAAARRVYVRD